MYNTRPNSVRDLHRRCTSSMCEQSSCKKFEYKGMKLVGVTDYTDIAQCNQSKGGVVVIMSKFNTPKNMINRYYHMCTA